MYKNVWAESILKLGDLVTTSIAVSYVSVIDSKTYDFDCAIPGTRGKCIFGNQIPRHGVDLPLVLLPRLNRKIGQRNIEQFHGAITTSCNYLVFIPLGPSCVVQRVLSIEPTEQVLA